MQLDENFEEILNAFFEKYDKKQFRHNKPHKIAVTFKGREDEVMAHLCKKYGVDPKTIAGMDLSSLSPAPGAQGEPTLEKPSKSEEKTNESVKEAESSPAEASAESNENPKSKKKPIVIILIVILLAAAGVAGYLFKDKIMEKISGTDQVISQENTEEVTPTKDEVEKTGDSPEAATDEQTSKEEDETEKVDEEGNDEGVSDEETSGEEK